MNGYPADNTFAKLSMIDLAGSERTKALGGRRGSRQIEGAAINKSLLALGNCITGLVRIQQKGTTLGDTAIVGMHIPYRDSKLTRVLRDSLLDTRCLILMIVTLNPNPSQYDETFNSLAFANKIKHLKVMTRERLNLYKPPKGHARVASNTRIETLKQANSALQ